MLKLWCQHCLYYSFQLTLSFYWSKCRVRSRVLPLFMKKSNTQIQNQNRFCFSRHSSTEKVVYLHRSDNAMIVHAKRLTWSMLTQQFIRCFYAEQTHEKKSVTLRNICLFFWSLAWELEGKKNIQTSLGIEMYTFRLLHICWFGIYFLRIPEDTQSVCRIERRREKNTEITVMGTWENKTEINTVYLLGMNERNKKMRATEVKKKHM